MIRGTVLVVDPDDLAQSMVAGILKDAGFGVIRAYDAVSALCVQAALPLAAVVASSNVAGADGGALVRSLQELNPDLPLILVTGGRGLPWLLHHVRRHLPNLATIRPPTA